MIQLIRGDCLVESEVIESGSVDLILTDLPYGTIKGIGNNLIPGTTGLKENLWDVVIGVEKVHVLANRILRKNGKMLLFGQQPFVTELINKAIPNLPFSYSMIWEKDNFANCLLSKKACVKLYEEILLFSKADAGDNNKARNYLIDQKRISKLTLTDINEILTGKRKSDLIGKRYFGTSQWEAPTKEMYCKLQSTGFF